MPKQDPRDFRERAIRLVNQSLGDNETEWGAIQRVPFRLGVSGETVRKWVRQAGVRPGVSESENAEILGLKKEVAELRRTNEILPTASAFSRRSSTDPHLDDLIRRCAS